MSDLLVVAGKELVDLRRNRFLAVLVAFLVIAVTLRRSSPRPPSASPSPTTRRTSRRCSAVEAP